MSKFKVAIWVLVLVGIISLNLAAALLNSLTIPSSGHISLGYTPPLHTEGKYVKDENNNTVYLRGIMKTTHIAVKGGWWHPEGSMNDYGYGMWLPEAVEYNLDQMQSLGYNVVRLHVPTVERWLPNQDGCRDEITYVIEQLNRRGMYAMIDNYAIGDPFGGQTAIPWDPYSKPTERGILPDREAFIDFWAGDADSLSAEYGHFPNVIYDLWNEPNGDSYLQQLYFEACQEIVNRLRAKGDEHLVVYQFGFSGMESNLALAQGQKLNGTNIVYSIHCYRTLSWGHTWHFFNGQYEYDDVKRILLGENVSRTYYVQNVIDNNLPLIITEMGAIREDGIVSGDTYENECTWFYNMMKCMNEWQFGYTIMEWYSSQRWFGILEDNTQYAWSPPLNARGEKLAQAILEGQTY